MKFITSTVGPKPAGPHNSGLWYLRPDGALQLAKLTGQTCTWVGIRIGKHEWQTIRIRKGVFHRIIEVVEVLLTFTFLLQLDLNQKFEGEGSPALSG